MMHYCKQAVIAAACSLLASAASAQAGNPVLTIDTRKVVAQVSPTLYGIMTEEINHSYDGGLYAELIQNRIFKDDPNKPAHWFAYPNKSDSSLISLDRDQHINDTLTVCLKLDAQHASSSNPVGVSNEGFWGIRVDPKTSYKVSFYAKTDAAGTGLLTVSLQSNDGKVLAQAQVKVVTNSWKQYSVNLTTTAGITPSADNQFVITAQNPGNYWFNLVSLFPPTYKNRKNGNRIDIMQKLAELNPKFLRFPGGNYVEGNSMAQYYNWKKTIGDLSVRPGHPGTWRYRSSDGIGILEFLNWTEDLHIEPVLAVFAGYTLNRQYIRSADSLQKYVDDALDEIEYVTGGVNTKWGAKRAADGHPAPFKLRYVEIGNEDFFDRSGSYEDRFAQFHDAIKAKYPNLKLIATTKVNSRVPDLVDDHFYRRPADFEKDTHHYDTVSRSGPKIFVGEWASRNLQNRNGSPTPNMECALGDACWMTGMERNSDLVLIAGYAPLFVNVSPGAMQWPINMIGYDAKSVYGSPSYYAQQMFYSNIGDGVLASQISGVSEIPVPPPPPRPNQNNTAPQPQEPANMPTISYVVTRDSKTGTVFLKVVNIIGEPQTMQINLQGAQSVSATGSTITLSGKPEDTNTITEPNKLVPITATLNNVKSNFSYTFLPYSITVLKIGTK